MGGLNSQEIIKLLDNLIGNVIGVGETNADNKALENLKTLIDVTNWCLDGIAQSAETSGATEWSKHCVGFHAKCCLDEYKTWLKERLEEWVD